MESGRLVILSGPSGVGKDTVIDAWRQAEPRVERVVAYTTRAPRAGEVDGVDYRFVSVDAFQGMAEEGAFLEHKRVFENYYATPAADTDRLLEAGKIAILKIDVQGALVAMALRPEAITVFLLPPSIEELRKRIMDRATDSEEVIARRLRGAEEEIAFSDRYRYRIVNQSVEDVVSRLQEIIA